MVKGISLTSGLGYTPTSVRPVHAFHLSSCTNVRVRMCEYFCDTLEAFETSLASHRSVCVCVCVSAPKCIFTVKHTFSLQTACPESPIKALEVGGVAALTADM